MTSQPGVEDLRLVDAMIRLGSIGAAARFLHVSQPSASQRLASLERRCGMLLFDRDTTGARPTPAGVALGDEARHILEHLASVYDRTREAAELPMLRVGTFSSLAPLLFPALDDVLPDVAVYQLSDHGDHLVADVAAGTLDAAVVGLAAQMRLPPGTTSTAFARDRLVLFRPAGAPPLRSGRRRWDGTTVAFHVLDFGGETLHAKITQSGGVPRRAATAATAVALARRHSGHALVTQCLARLEARAGDVVEKSPLAAHYTLSAVTRSPAPPALVEVLPTLREAMGLERMR